MQLMLNGVYVYPDACSANDKLKVYAEIEIKIKQPNWKVTLQFRLFLQFIRNEKLKLEELSDIQLCVFGSEWG